MTTKLIAESTEGSKIMSPQSPLLSRTGQNTEPNLEAASLQQPGVATPTPDPTPAQPSPAIGITSAEPKTGLLEDETMEGFPTPPELTPGWEKSSIAPSQAVHPTPTPSIFPGKPSAQIHAHGQISISYLTWHNLALLHRMKAMFWGCQNYTALSFAKKAVPQVELCSKERPSTRSREAYSSQLPHPKASRPLTQQKVSIASDSRF